LFHLAIFWQKHFSRKTLIEWDLKTSVTLMPQNTLQIVKDGRIFAKLYI